MERKKLNEQFPDWITGDAIFSALQAFNVPWQSENIASVLDYEYFGNYSGEKFISPLVRKLNERTDISDADRITLLANTIFNIYKVSWQKEYETLSFQYDAVGNYNVTETMTNDSQVDIYGRTSTRTDNLSHTKTGTETEAPNTTETRTDNLTRGTTPNITTESDVYGFNSSTAVPAGVQTNTGTTTETNTGTQATARTGQDTITYNTTNSDTGTQAVAEGGQDTHTRNYNLTRRGTLGLVPVQTLVSDERELWLWNFFQNVVFPDVDKILTIPIY